MEEIERMLLSTVFEELGELLKNRATGVDTDSFVYKYLFRRMPQMFEKHQVDLRSLSIISFTDYYLVTVNFKHTAKLKLKP
ncbi:hypothetical protein [Algoriphagus aquimarinus]|uniref:Uncharacterized protein n=1 Tax=Algoriphagus aquimarinus TaxID=237018 RepID=A0A5C7APD3_9BACT|nr:hypothetical protein [Algoriphagus aquimarinus]TXE10221.1 hypothetical protein ESV85_12840 [Algoriphagus aquimarinus]